MDVIDELYQRVAFQIPTEEFIHIIQLLVRKKQDDIDYIKNKIAQYEQKRRKEEAMYQSLSPIRKLFTGRPPSHHTAVEYMVYVKEPFKKIEVIKREIRELARVLKRIEDNPDSDEIMLSTHLINQLTQQEREDQIDER
ncbi:hypothetical protein EJP77_00705 [Paenibacillus zeisoli]|uniref:Uncharacterized protein n=1 Tax=Paenibacillus zeisoli TaxID=2496267 RepID=A0A433XN93_9BACL|nr:hypothetical protein [Paenibacillus zeisoli]RUT35577.1 hypothetical protein EJP77_00705 [Paenibacillus zeisoli]